MIPLLIGIAGGSASGKSSITQKLMHIFGHEQAVVINHDSYYFDRTYFKPKTVDQVNYDHPDALETSLLIEHLVQLKSGISIESPVYDFSTHERQSETKRVDSKPVIIVDGILLFVESRLRELFNIKIFVDADSDIRLARRLKRDIESRGRDFGSVMHQYMDYVKPMHLEFVEPSKRWADIIIPRGAENSVAIHMVENMIRTWLKKGIGVTP